MSVLNTEDKATEAGRYPQLVDGIPGTVTGERDCDMGAYEMHQTFASCS